ncbi:sugar phosphate isomerase/epimerase [Cryobacterium sp. Y50]|uniref:sugar phosphate isomerase/epimerase family protein n=1 Tax=Cryobacterium sp. Y50 TaxID=2048286 RepID=UPI0018EC7F7C|nr:sugar phosphate isomerase/epimerase family protein [Cryobacterium sp. Y50]
MTSQSHAAMLERIGCSTISFREMTLDQALDAITTLGITQIDLGGIPAVCSHVPVPFSGTAARYGDAMSARGLQAGAINVDIGELNHPDFDAEEFGAIADPIIGLAASLGAAIILPCGAPRWQPMADERRDLDRIAENLTVVADRAAASGVRVLVEALHFGRFSHNVTRANSLLERLDPQRFGVVFDISHVVAAEEDEVAWAIHIADRIERVHLRDAVPGDINLGIGRGVADFAGVISALEQAGFVGHYVLELETHDITSAQRVSDAARSRDLIALLLLNTTNER